MKNYWKLSKKYSYLITSKEVMEIIAMVTIFRVNKSKKDVKLVISLQKDMQNKGMLANQ